MSKTVNIFIEVNYDDIRKSQCLVDGKILSDEEIDKMISERGANIEINEEAVKGLFATLYISKFIDRTPKPKSNFQERLEKMQDAQLQQKLNRP